MKTKKIQTKDLILSESESHIIQSAALILCDLIKLKKENNSPLIKYILL